MPGRSPGNTAYPFTFNGQRDDKWNGNNSSHVDFGMRIHDARLGRFFSEDPFKKFIHNKSSYAFAGNSPIAFVDYNGGFMIDATTGGTRKQRAQLERAIKRISVLINSNLTVNDPDPTKNNLFLREFLIQSGLPLDASGVEQARTILSYGQGPTVRIGSTDEIGSNLGMMPADAQGNPMPNIVYINSMLLNEDPPGASEGTQKYNESDTRWHLDQKLLTLLVLWHEGMHVADNLDCVDQGIVNPSARMDIGDNAEFNVVGVDIGNVNDLSRLRGEQSFRTSRNVNTSASKYSVFSDWRRSSAFSSSLLKLSFRKIGTVSDEYQGKKQKSKMTSYGNDRFVD